MAYSYIHKDVAFKVSVTQIENSHLKQRVSDALNDIFKGFSRSESEYFAMEFIFTDKIEKFIKDTEFVRVKDIKVGHNQTHFKDDELNFLIDLYPKHIDN